MNELKPEDVMRALDILDKMDFFQGQRAGRELWNEKPFEVQEQDIADFSQGIEFVKNLITNALALFREKDARIKELEEAQGAEFTCFVGNPHKVDHCPYCDEIVRLQKEVDEKDAEIERLTTDLQAMRSAANSLKMHLEALQDEFFDYQADVQTDVAYARAEAIDEFADGCVAMAIGIGNIPVVCLESILKFAEKMKGESYGNEQTKTSKS